MRIPSFPPAYRGSWPTSQVDNKVYQTLERLSAVQSAQGMRTHVNSTGVLSVNDQVLSFWALLTAVTLNAGIPQYDWKMLIENTDGTFQLASAEGIQGQGADSTQTDTYFPAFEVNKQIVPTNTITTSDGYTGTVVRMYWSYGPWVYFEYESFSGASSTTYTFNHDTFTYTNNVVNYSGGNTFNYSSTDTINYNGGPVYYNDPTNWYLQGGSELAINGPSYLQLNSAVAFGGATIWDCIKISPPGSTVNDWAMNLVTGAVTGATNASPIVLTVPGWYTQPLVGQTVRVQNVLGNTAANGFYRVQAATATTVTLAGSVGNGAFVASPNSTVTVLCPMIDVDTSAGDVTITGCQPAAVPVQINSGAVTNATNASPIVLTVPAWTIQPQTGDLLAVNNINGNLNANGVFTVLSATGTTATLSGTTGSGAFVASPSSEVLLLQTQPQLMIWNNIGTHNLTLTNQDSNSLAINRFQFPPKYGTLTGASPSALTLNPNDSVEIWWDDCDLQCWRVEDCTVAIYTVCTSVLLTNATYNNYALPTLIAPHTEVNITNTTGTATITGFAAQTPSFGPVKITLINTSTQSLVLSHNNAGSSAGNRIFLPPTYGTTSVTLAQYDTITLWYDSCAGTPGWYVQACTVDSDSSSGTTSQSSTGTLTNPYTLTSTFANIGLSVALPAAGKYQLTANLSGFAQGNTSGATLSVDAKLRDTTAGADVTNSLGSLFYIGSCIGSTQYGGSTSITIVYTASGANTIDLQASGSATVGVFTGSIRAGGYTRLSYVRLS